MCNEGQTVVHVRAIGDNDTLHYIWDLNRQPSVLVALTELDVNVTIDWDSLSKDVSRLTFSTKPKYTMSFILTKVSERLHAISIFSNIFSMFL